MLLYICIHISHEHPCAGSLAAPVRRNGVINPMSNANFPHLFSPIQIGSKTYKNRVCASPLGNTMVRPDGTYPASSFEWYEKRARGGCAEVMTSETVVDFDYGNRMKAPSVDFTAIGSKHMQGVKAYNEMLHSYGAVSLVELNHCGLERMRSAGENGPIGPSGVTRADGVSVTEMDEALMALTVQRYADAAYYLQQAGYDGVAPHMASGWLLQQFFSPRTNLRTDEYGGSLENRARFPLRVIRAIRERCGKDFLIVPRLSVEENVPGGYGVEDGVALCKLMEGLIDAVHVVCGVYYEPILSGEFSSMYAPHNLNAELSAAVKQAVSYPVIVCGGINSPEEAEDLIASGKADLVALGRQMIADPEWACKAESGRADDIARCIRCFRCFPGPLQEAADTMGAPPDRKCTVNPCADLNELDVPIGQWPSPNGAKNVLVIGGGIAGLTAAYTAAVRGHKVTLAEKSGVFGGLLTFADHDHHKVDLMNYKNLAVRRCEQAGVTLLLNTEITPENVMDYAPDAVIISVGSTPVVPRIPGIETAIHALDAYCDPDKVGQKVVMAGGGLVGCETALNFASLGRDVTIVEMQPAVAVDSYKMHRVALLDELSRAVTVRTGLKCTGFSEEGVSALDADGSEVFLPADTVIFAMGMRANTAAAEALEQVLEGKAETYRIGDCIRASKIQQAVEEGFLAAMKIL